MLRRLALTLIVIVVLAVAVAFLIPLDSLRGPIETAASSALGRQVQISGHLRLAVFPELGISLKDVSIANAAGAHEPQMIAVGKAVMGADLSSLLSGHLRITKVVLKEPAIHLELAGNGVGNWQIGQAAAAENASSSVSLSVDQVRVENGEVSFLDARTGKSETLSAVSVTLTEPFESGESRPLGIEGSATYRGAPVQFSTKLEDALGFLQAKPCNATVKVNSAKFTAAFTGRLAPSGEATGDVAFTAPSLRQLAAWVGQPLPPGNGFGAITVQASLSATSSALALHNAKIALDGMSVGGDVSVDILHSTVKAELNSIAAYGGTGRATVSLDAGGVVPSIQETLDMRGVQIGPFLQQVMGVAKLQATGTAHLEVSARGLTENEIIRSLNGRGSVTLSNGAITGVDLGAVAKLLQSTARALGGALGGGSRTDFSSLSSSFTIRNGVVQTSDLQMSSSTINMTGAGSVDLASQQVNFHIVPKAQLGVAGVNLVDIGIPFYVRGTIDNPSFDPDPAGIAKGVVGAAAGTATGVANTVGDTATKVLSVPGGAIKSLFGN
ncbi:MAG TPA: AsmA family protein [Stellaceae bacterium]|nr:AsmA family protein [Stellaceae bacterium]